MQKKNYSSLIICLAILIVFGVKIPRTFAGTVIFFPDSSRLQPKPIDAFPNISGNINWPNVDSGVNQDQNVPDTSSSNTTSNTPQNSSPTYTATGSGNPAENNGVQNSATPYTNSPTNTSANGQTSSGYSGSNTNNTSNSSNPTNQQNSNSSGVYFPSGFDTVSPQENPVENNDTSSDSVTSQNETQPQKAATNSTFVWILTFSSMILFAAAFVLWKLKKIPNDVN